MGGEPCAHKANCRVVPREITGRRRHLVLEAAGPRCGILSEASTEVVLGAPAVHNQTGCLAASIPSATISRPRRSRGRDDLEAAANRNDDGDLDHAGLQIRGAETGPLADAGDGRTHHER